METKKASLWKRIAIGATALCTGFLPQETARAEEATIPNTFRTRIEQTGNLESDKTLTKLTLGFAPESNAKSFAETARVYQYFNEENHENDYTSIAVKTPRLSLEGTTTQATLFGTFGSKDGLGIETSTQVGDSTLNLVYEQAIKEGQDSTRIGGGLDQKIGKLTLGIGYDQVETSANTTDYFLVNSILDIDNKNQTGIGLRVADNGETRTTSANAFYCHYNDSWGARARAGLDNSDTGLDVETFEVIVAQNPSFSQYSSPWMVGRRATGDWFNTPLVENPSGDERTPLGDRSKGGLVGAVKGCLIDNNGTDSGYVYGEVGYKLPLTTNASVTASVFANRSLAERNEDTTLGASILTRIGNWTLEATGDEDSTFYGSVTYSHSFGGK